MTTRESKILLRYQLKDEVSRGLEGISGNIQKHSRAAGLALTAVGVAGILAGKAVVTAAIEQQNAERVLAAAVDATGASWAAQREEILKTTAALQQKTAVGDEAQIRALVTLTNALGNSRDALAALPLALDASAASGRDLQAVVNTLGRALAGQVNTSISLNTTFEKTQDFQSRLAQGFAIVGGSAAANLDPLKLISVTVGDLGEKIGAALLPVLVPLAQMLAQVAVVVGEFMENNKLLFQILVPIVGVLVLLAAIIGPILIALPFLAAGVAIVSLAMFGWIIAIVAVVAAVIFLTVIIIKNWDAIRDAVIGTINLIIRAINALVEALFQLSGFGILNRISGALGGPSISGVPNIPTVPTMDTGGLVRGPGMFQVGAGVTEIVRTPGGGAGGGGIVVNIPASSLIVVQDRASLRRFASIIEREINQTSRGRARFGA